jgi:hypothetical protein
MIVIRLFNIIAEKSMTFTDYDIEIKSLRDYFIYGEKVLF